jgi:hypothetical protein
VLYVQKNRHHQRGGADHQILHRDACVPLQHVEADRHDDPLILIVGGPLCGAWRATLRSGSLFDLSGFADQERAQGHSHCMESQRTHKSTEVGEPFYTGEDPSHYVHYSDKTRHQQQDTNDP